jgi:hypothetical protein
VAIYDALKIFEGPIVEVHISNIHARDELHRHQASAAATTVICGMGPYGYHRRHGRRQPGWWPSSLTRCRHPIRIGPR